jgi:hypothetical protein
MSSAWRRRRRPTSWRCAVEPAMAKKPRSSSATEDVWSRYSLNGVTHVAFIERLLAHKDLLIQRGGFTEADAIEALRSPQSQKKESVAAWLRRELKILNVSQKQVGRAPFLTGESLSRPIIGDLAVTLLQYCGEAPGLHLVYQIAELLEVGCHRTALARKADKKLQLAACVAQLSLQGASVSDRRLAKELSVSPTTVGEWKRSVGFKDDVELFKQSRKDDIREHLEKVRIEYPGIRDQDAVRLAFEREREASATE